MKTHLFELTTFETREVVTRYSVEAKSEKEAQKLFDVMVNMTKESIDPLYDMSEDEEAVQYDSLNEDQKRRWAKMAETGEELSNSFRSIDFIYDNEYLGTDIPC
jgi:hypothetical protein